MSESEARASHKDRLKGTSIALAGSTTALASGTVILSEVYGQLSNISRYLDEANREGTTGFAVKSLTLATIGLVGIIVADRGEKMMKESPTENLVFDSTQNPNNQ